MMPFVLVAAAAVLLVLWYRHVRVIDTEATIRLQSQHEFFYLHVDLPKHLQIQPGDTVHVINVPELETGRTDEGEISYHSPVRLYKASWLQRFLIRNSSLVEVSELVDHP
jgi:hypothetical protein